MRRGTSNDFLIGTNYGKLVLDRPDCIGSGDNGSWFLRVDGIVEKTISDYNNKKFSNIYNKLKDIPNPTEEDLTDFNKIPEEDELIELFIFTINKAVAEEVSHSLGYKHSSGFIPYKKAELENFCRRLIREKPEEYGQYTIEELVEMFDGKVVWDFGRPKKVEKFFSNLVK